MRRAALPLIALVAACGGHAQPAATGQAPITGAQSFAEKPFTATPIADFVAPWAMVFLPDGRMLVTEKAGQLWLVSADGKQRAAIAEFDVSAEGQGGLMDVVLHPNFSQNHLVYVSYVEAGQGGKGVVLARGEFIVAPAECPRGPHWACGTMLNHVEVIFRAQPYVAGNGHFSGRIAFSPDGKYLFFTNGERQKFTPAQDPNMTLGKVLRLNDDGTPAAGNPLAAQGFNPAIWTDGHRNLLGIAFDAQGRLWEQEMGPQGGDELNLILPGRNYGYPIVSNGDHYDGKVIPDHPTRPEFEAPKVSWNPVISPAGLIIYSGAMFPAWRGNALIGGLSAQSLVRIEFDGNTAREAARYDMGARIREVEQGPDGAIYLLEDGDESSQGRLLRLTPKA